MSANRKPSERLLSSLRRLAGDAPTTVRIMPVQWVQAANEIGLAEVERREAVTTLCSEGYIRFSPESTEIIALTEEGVAAANLLKTREQNRQVSDPMPASLEDIREELDYWEPRLYLGDPGSIWWEQVQARIDGLRHRENRLLSTRPTVSVTNNAIGPNSRFNQNSVDHSTNQVIEVVRSAEWERMAEELSVSCRFLRADSQWTSNSRKERWTIAGGENGMCKALLQRAGAMLLKSPRVRPQLTPEIISEIDDAARWLLYLKQLGFHEPTFPAYELLDDGTKITHIMGSIKDLARSSAEVCARCAAIET